MKSLIITAVALFMGSQSAYASASAQKIMDKGCEAVKDEVDREDCKNAASKYLSANKTPCDPELASFFKIQMVASLCEKEDYSPDTVSECLQGSRVIEIFSSNNQQTISASADTRSVIENFSGSKNDIEGLVRVEKQTLNDLLKDQSQAISEASLTDAPRYDSQCHLIKDPHASNVSVSDQVMKVLVQIYSLADPEKAVLLGSGNLR